LWIAVVAAGGIVKAGDPAAEISLVGLGRKSPGRD
jgi:hypothetical protein